MKTINLRSLHQPLRRENLRTNVPSGDIDTDFKYLAELAEETLKMGERLEPTFFIIDSKNRKMGVVSGEDLPEQSDLKQAIFENIGIDYAKRMPEADCFVFMTEAWLSVEKEGQPMTRPSDDPNRKEIILLCAKRLNGDEKYYSREIVTLSDGTAEIKAEQFLKEINSDWEKAGKEGKMTNTLLTAAWRKFIFTKLFNEALKNGYDVA